MLWSTSCFKQKVRFILPLEPAWQLNLWRSSKGWAFWRLQIQASIKLLQCLTRLTTLSLVPIELFSTCFLRRIGFGIISDRFDDPGKEFEKTYEWLELDGQHGLVAAELAAPGLVAAADERFEQRTADAHARKNARKKQQLVAEATILTAVADCCLCYAVLSRV